MPWGPKRVTVSHLASLAVVAYLALVQAACAASGTLEVPALRIGQGTGKLVPVLIGAQAEVGRLSFRLTLDPRYGTWGAEGSLAEGGNLNEAFAVTAEVASDDAQSLDVAIVPKTGQEGSTAPMVAAGRSVVAYTYVTPKLGLRAGGYAVAVSQVVGLDTKGSPIDLSPVSGSLTVAAGGGRLLGDLDLNGKVSVSDCVLALKLVAGIIKPGGQGAERFIALADVSPTHGDGTVGDGRLDVKDLVRLLKHVAGLEPGPWPGGLQYASAEIGPGGGTLTLADGSIALSVPP
ncbi:MAG TPA: dockerin type I repeat-containing protein, partial [Armatimonadota bacterium]